MPASDHGFPVADLSDEQLAQLRRDVLHEQAKRKQIGTSPEKIEQAIDAYQRESGKGQGEEWEPPARATDSYRFDALVTLDGELWRSLLSANPHRPGTAGWRLEPTLDEDGNEMPPRFVRPSSAADAYGPGDRITWTDGKVYEAQRVGVDWDPDTAPQDWELAEEEPEPDPPEDEEPDPEEPTDPEEPEPGDGDEDEDDEPEPEPEEPEPEPDEPAPAEWVQPTGGHDAYNTGDAVTFEGAVYANVMDGNVWSPSAHPAGWERQE